MHAWYVTPHRAVYAFQCMWTLTTASGLAVRACLAVSVSHGPFVLVLCLASRVMLAVKAPGRERERERDYTYPALRQIQVLPGHPLADPKDETVSSIQRRTSL